MREKLPLVPVCRKKLEGHFCAKNGSISCFYDLSLRCAFYARKGNNFIKHSNSLQQFTKLGLFALITLIIMGTKVYLVLM